MTPSHYTLDDFNFDLPPELIAQHLLAQRSASRLLDGTQDPAVHRVFSDLPQVLAPGDLLVFNDTQVIKARLYGRKSSGGAVELLVDASCQSAMRSGPTFGPTRARRLVRGCCWEIRPRVSRPRCSDVVAQTTGFFTCAGPPTP